MPIVIVDQILDNMLRVCVRVLREREEQLTIGGILYYNSCSSSITMTLFEALHKREYKTHRAGVT